MSATFEYEATVRNYRGGRELTLTVLENDGAVGVGLTLIGEDGADQRMSALEVEEAEAVIAAIRRAVDRAKAKRA